MELYLEAQLILQDNNIAQLILDSKKKCNLVIAAAGSGKTSLLIDILVKKIRSREIDPINEEVIVFTFTNNAADELAFRLTQIMGAQEDVLNNIFIGTIHGWCNAFLKKNGTLANTKVIDELEQYQLLLRIFPITSLKEEYNEKNKFQKIEAFAKDLELFYNEDLELDNHAVPNKVKKVVTEYLNFINGQRLLDFGSLVRETIRQLRSANNTKRYHLFIDEYQDVNLAQVRLFQALLNLDHKSTLFAVGDPRPAIYQWRGGDLRRILNFAEDFDNVETHTMNINYRSRPGIIELANAVAVDIDFSSWGSSRFKANDMKPNSKRIDNQISVIHLKGDYSQEKEIVNLIENLHKKGVGYSDIAILMRSVLNHSEELMNRLDEKDIPYFSPNKNAGIQFIQEFFGSVINLMDLMANPYEQCSRQEEEEIMEKINKSLQLIKKYSKNSTLSAIHLAVSEWYEKLSTPKRSRSGRVYFLNEAYNFRQQLFDFCKKIGLTLDESNSEIIEGFSAITQIMRAIEEIYRRRFRGSGTSLRTSPIEVFLRNLKWQLNHEIERWAEVGMEVSDKAYTTSMFLHIAICPFSC